MGGGGVCVCVYVSACVHLFIDISPIHIKAPLHNQSDLGIFNKPRHR